MSAKEQEAGRGKKRRHKAKKKKRCSQLESKETKQRYLIFWVSPLASAARV
jgi:hypothetical protein